MTYRLPPLNALRAFEAAARHLSIRGAAAELHVTPGAVGQQVRSLERMLGVVLFERVHQGLMLTEAGQRYLLPLRRAFDTISIATEDVAPRTAGAGLVIATSPDFAVNWLLPALDGFTRSHPSLRLTIADGAGPDVVLRGRAQIALLAGLSRHPELVATPVVDDLRFVAGTPRLDDSPEPLFGETLGTATLLIAGDEGHWREILAAGGAPDLEQLTSVAFARRDLAVRAAELGRGMVLASTVEDVAALESSRLVPLANGPTLVAARWYALCPAGRIACPEERAVLDWLARVGAATGRAAAVSAA